MDKETILKAEASRVIGEAFKKGCTCTVCGQFVKAYRRKLNSSMAAALIHAHNVHGSCVAFHLKDIAARIGLTSTGDFAKLRHFDLIKEVPHDPNDTSKKSSGMWYVTTLGEMFVLGLVRVSKHVVIYNGHVLDHSDEKTSIEDALNDKFNYETLMQGAIG